MQAQIFRSFKPITHLKRSGCLIAKGIPEDKIFASQCFSKQTAEKRLVLVIIGVILISVCEKFDCMEVKIKGVNLLSKSLQL